MPDESEVPKPAQSEKPAESGGGWIRPGRALLALVVAYVGSYFLLRAPALESDRLVRFKYPGAVRYYSKSTTGNALLALVKTRSVFHGLFKQGHEYVSGESWVFEQQSKAAALYRLYWPLEQVEMLLRYPGIGPEDVPRVPTRE